jgi:hypothetical protein
MRRRTVSRTSRCRTPDSEGAAPDARQRASWPASLQAGRCGHRLSHCPSGIGRRQPVRKPVAETRLDILRAPFPIPRTDRFHLGAQSPKVRSTPSSPHPIIARHGHRVAKLCRSCNSRRMSRSIKRWVGIDHHAPMNKATLRIDGVRRSSVLTRRQQQPHLIGSIWPHVDRTRLSALPARTA